MNTQKNRIQRIGVYGICVKNQKLLLVRASSLTEVAGRWFLPGGGVDYGEEPINALRREVKEETGLNATIGDLLGIVTDERTRSNGVHCHTVRIIYAVTDATGELADETAGSSDQARWIPLDEAAQLPIAQYAKEALRLKEIIL